MNKLQNSQSPYLLQHANNPVDWYPWNEEAWLRAEREKKPVLISIGYSTCHWCHVMEKESFMDPDIAAFMNKHFINIKIDREERPDLDQIYMDACQILTGQAGWPLNVFLTPDKKPFYAGTYFPPESIGKRLSWSQVLQFIHFNFQKNQSAVENQASQTLEKMNKIENLSDAESSFHPESDSKEDIQLKKIFAGFSSRMDLENGGFGGAPKFPNLAALEFLLAFAQLSGEKSAQEHVTKSVNILLRGGIYDQIGGGIFRYAVDATWRIPHFEKMLYDNAQWIKILSQVYAVTKRKKYARAIKESINFALTELMSDEGLFFTALDADSEGIEGKYYTWKEEELIRNLNQDASLICKYFGVTGSGNWENTNILNQPHDLFQFAKDHHLEIPICRNKIDNAKVILKTIRDKRLKPHRDEKVVLGWNAMMISAFIHAGNALNDETYRTKATQSLHQLWETFYDRDIPYLKRSAYQGTTKHKATLSDHAFLIRAILDHFQLYSEELWLTRAHLLTKQVLQYFSDPDSPLLFQASNLQDDLILRKKDIIDTDFPSGNSVMVQNFTEIGTLLHIPAYLTRANEILKIIEPRIMGDPLAFSAWAHEMLVQWHGRPEIAILGDQAIDFTAELKQKYIPGLILMNSIIPQDQYPLLIGRWKPGETWIYLCQNYSCQRPVQNVEDLPW